MDHVVFLEIYLSTTDVIASVSSCSFATPTPSHRWSCELDKQNDTDDADIRCPGRQWAWKHW